jgi:prepilin-type N-terminal cleavage/methylation domain-containing protein
MRRTGQTGFSILELLVAMSIMLVLLGIISMLFTRAVGVRNRESRRTDALTSAQAALNIISREISNSGFGLYSDPVRMIPNNGIVLADSDGSHIRVRANITNTESYSNPTLNATSDPGEDVMYFLDTATSSIVRYDRNAVPPTPAASVVVNKISNVTFQYVNFTVGSSSTTTTVTPTVNTGQVNITIVVQLDPIVGQPNPGTVTFTSNVTLRNANYVLQQY